MSDNPYLNELDPGESQAPLMRWSLGVVLTVALAWGGLSIMRAGEGWIPFVIRQPAVFFRRHDVTWVRVEGPAAVCLGMALFGAAIAIHGRYYWRYTHRGWYFSEVVLYAGVAIALTSLVVSYGLSLWRMLA